jgi:hypothetical protein
LVYAKKFCSLYAAMAGDYHVSAVNQNGVGKTERLNARCNLSALMSIVCSCIMGIRHEHAGW